MHSVHLSAYTVKCPHLLVCIVQSAIVHVFVQNVQFSVCNAMFGVHSVYNFQCAATFGVHSVCMFCALQCDAMFGVHSVCISVAGKALEGKSTARK